jgi:hypothetical protein
MRKSTIIIALLVSLLASGCGREEMTQEERGYLAGVRYYPTKELDSKSDSELIELGDYTCELFYYKVTPNEVIEKVVERGNITDPETLEAIMTNALLGFCPEYSDVLNYG